MLSIASVLSLLAYKHQNTRNGASCWAEADLLWSKKNRYHCSLLQSYSKVVLEALVLVPNPFAQLNVAPFSCVIPLLAPLESRREPLRVILRQ